jgi:hypothetical protein
MNTPTCLCNRLNMEKTQIPIPSLTINFVNSAYPGAIPKHPSNSLSSRAYLPHRPPSSHQPIYQGKDQSSRQSVPTYLNNIPTLDPSVQKVMLKLDVFPNSENLKLHPLDHLIPLLYHLHHLSQPLHLLMLNYQIIRPSHHSPRLQHTLLRPLDLVVRAVVEEVVGGD